MSIPFEIPIVNQDVVNGVSYAGTTLTLTRAEGSDLTTTITPSTQGYFGIDFFPTTFNGDLDGLQYLTQVGPDPNVGPNPIMFINLPFNYKVIGVSIALDTDGPHTGTGEDYHFQIQTRTAGNNENTGTPVGDVLQLNNVKSRMSKSGLFTTNMSYGPSTDIALHLDSTASGASPEIIMKLWLQTV